MITIIDSGISNIGSLVNMLRKIGAPSLVTNNPEEIKRAEKIILPGIGSFDAGMQRLAELDIIGVLNEKVMKEKIPTLGICLGMQLMAAKSSEGKLPGLNWFDGEVVRFDFSKLNDASIKIPHMGWNFVEPKKPSRLFKDLQNLPRFYFVHGYHFKEKQNADVLGITQFGYPFASAIEKENIAGVQFHPEKSHKFGMQLLKNFIEQY
ncbi:MAG: imidazole glycerol phosphate synthase subunit HisH [Chitinophagales bacterium]|nr:imidazole glycerol phosphate synthase subunit HisH [Chitinophagales bacterium]